MPSPYASFAHIDTHQLNLRDVFLPPDGIPELRPERGQEVVEVHDDMHKTVDQPQQCRVAPWNVKKAY